MAIYLMDKCRLSSLDIFTCFSYSFSKFSGSQPLWFHFTGLESLLQINSVLLYTLSGKGVSFESPAPLFCATTKYKLSLINDTFKSTLINLFIYWLTLTQYTKMFCYFVWFCLLIVSGAIAMSILFLSFKPPVKLDSEHWKPYHQFYIWIGVPIEVSK